MIRVIIANASTAVSDQLHDILDNDPDIYIAGRASRPAELEFLLPQCDLALVNDTFHGAKTIDLINALTDDHATAKVIVMGLPRRPDEILPYLAAGAHGYLLENDTPANILAKIKATAAERAIVSPTVASAVMERISDLASANPTLGGNQIEKLSALTPRQQEVLQLVSEGMTNQEIADTLFIQKGTVKNHVHHILKRLGVDNRQDAAAVYQMGREVSDT